MHRKKNQEISALADKALTLWSKAENKFDPTRCLEKISYALEAESYYLQVCEKMISQKSKFNEYMSNTLLHECIISIPVIALSIALMSPTKILSTTLANKKSNELLRNVNPFLYAMH